MHTRSFISLFLVIGLAVGCKTMAVTEADIKSAQDCGPMAANYKEQVLDTFKGKKLLMDGQTLGAVSQPSDGLLTEGNSKVKGKIVHVDSINPDGRPAMRHFFFVCGNSVSLKEFSSCYYPGNRSSRAVDCSKN